jgi:hypothetical protein
LKSLHSYFLFCYFIKHFNGHFFKEDKSEVFMGIKNILKLNTFVIIPILISITLSFSAGTKKFVVAVSATTKSYGGEWADSGNCTIMWIQKPDKTFIKTIQVGFEITKYAQYFTTWTASAGGKLLLDGVTGATRDHQHKDTVKGYWDGTGRDNKLVPNGTYQFWIEMTEDDGPGKVTYGSIEIDGKAKKVTGNTSTYFPYFEAMYDPAGVGTINKTKTVSTNGLHITSLNSKISVELPNSSLYSVFLISPLGKVITTSKGSGKHAVLATSKLQMSSGMYFIKVVQSGKTYTISQILGF